VIDLRMPGMSGLDLVRELVTRHPAMHVVVLTGYGSIGHSSGSGASRRAGLPCKSRWTPTRFRRLR